MNAAQLIDALHAAGGTLVIENGRPRLRGAAISDELKATLKANREAVLAEWEQRQLAHRDRYGVIPTGEVQMAGRDVRSLTEAQVTAVAHYVIRQPKTIHAWWNSRATEYHALGMSPEESGWRAAVDVLAWQMNRPALAALEVLAGIEECAANLPKPQICTDETQIKTEQLTTQKET